MPAKNKGRVGDDAKMAKAAKAAKAAAARSLAAKSIPAEPAELQLPNWPALQPLVPASDLSLETLLDDQIVLIRKLFTSSLCQQYVSFLASLPLVTTPGRPKKGEAVRVNDRFQVYDPAFAEQLWSATSLKQMVTQSDAGWGGQICGLNPNIRIYRYRKGQFFDQHYDEANLVALPGKGVKEVVSARTTWTLLIYLTGPTTGCIGGETVFYPDEGTFGGKSRKSNAGRESVSVVPEAGMALLHKHGNDCMLHEGRVVEAGEKWIIRSDLCVVR